MVTLTRWVRTTTLFDRQQVAEAEALHRRGLISTLAIYGVVTAGLIGQAAM